MVESSPRRSAPEGRKNRLFCPHCGHESPTDGDWRVLATAAGAVYRCPDCGAAVTTRPGDEAGPCAAALGAAGLASPVAAWLRLACAWTAWPGTLSASRGCSGR